MAKTSKSSSRIINKKGKKQSRIGSKTRKVRSQKKATTRKQSSKSTGSRTKQRKAKTSEIIIKRTSGRKERFETDKMAQNVSRSGTPFLLAREVAKTVSEKVIQKSRNDDDNTSAAVVADGGTEASSYSPTEVNAAEVRRMVSDELKERNRPDIALSYSGERPENTRQGRHELMKENQPLHNADAANTSKLVFDTSTKMAKSTRPSSMKR
jgi:transcriptional repressor NrdR